MASIFFDVIMLVYITPPAPASAQSPSRTRPAYSVSPDKKADPLVPVLHDADQSLLSDAAFADPGMAVFVGTEGI